MLHKNASSLFAAAFFDDLRLWLASRYRVLRSKAIEFEHDVLFLSNYYLSTERSSRLPYM